MVTKCDGYFKLLIDPEFVDNFPDRIQWRGGTLEARKGTDGKKLDFPYMFDAATGKWYIAHDPMRMGSNFFFAAVTTPVLFAATTVFNLIDLVTAFIRIAYRTFSDVYPNIDEGKIAPLVLEKFKEHLSEEEPKFRRLWEKFKNSVTYAPALEVAALYGFIYSNDAYTVCKMKIIFAELEKKWNNNVDYSDTPISHFKRIYNKKAEVTNENDSENTAEVINQIDLWKMKIGSLDLKDVKPALYIMQFFQPRHWERIKPNGEKFTSHIEFREAIKRAGELFAANANSAENLEILTDG
ncbi:MAG: hypothetical protein K1060chlam2_00873 [Chlamydiae bacterium]|nr:hypothetical protein [Chlamydiota bacterium]